jgi:hypothetical protein
MSTAHRISSTMALMRSGLEHSGSPEPGEAKSGSHLELPICAKSGDSMK